MAILPRPARSCAVAVKYLVLACLAVLAFVIASLAAGAGYLEVLLPRGLPLGNVLVPAGLCAGALVPLVVGPPASAVRTLAAVALALSLLWLPVSVGLSGNLAIDGLQGWRGAAWLGFSAVTALLVLVALVWGLAGAAVRRWRRRGDAPATP